MKSSVFLFQAFALAVNTFVTLVSGAMITTYVTMRCCHVEHIVWHPISAEAIVPLVILFLFLFVGASVYQVLPRILRRLIAIGIALLLAGLYFFTVNTVRASIPDRQKTPYCSITGIIEIGGTGIEIYRL